MDYLQKLEGHTRQQKLKEQLRQQLAKDLQVAPREVPQQGLLSWLEQELRLPRKEDLAQLLYRVDVDERHLNPHDLNTVDLAKSILEREAQKVLFRAQYSGNL